MSKKTSNADRSIVARWSDRLIRDGWTPVSNYFLDNYHRLKPPIHQTEALFIIHLLRFKWDAQSPYPSLVKIAKSIGLSASATRSIARSLDKKGYVRRCNRKGKTNLFEVQGLFKAMERMWLVDIENRTRLQESLVLTPGAADLSVDELFREMEMLSGLGQPGAVVVLAFLAIERALAEHSKWDQSYPLSARLNYAVARRVITEQVARRVLDLVKWRNKIVHGEIECPPAVATAAIDTARQMVAETGQLERQPE